ncbi:MAG: DsbA family protein [Candidatus Aenigmarchaeota archaeon]|nr:DsbA family protein [Candidatus Aenigmarchaeota archaeon]
MEERTRKSRESHQDAVTIPKNTVKWVALLLVALNVFTFLIGSFVQTGASGANIAPQGSGDAAAPPSRVTVTDVGAYSIGDEDAKITIIEYSDFQCPFCRSFWQGTLPEVKSAYIDTGKTRLEYRHFPLSFHPAAQPSAEAAECAGDQGKFWEAHDAIFSNQAKQGQGTISYTKNDLKAWLSGVQGLDVEKAMKCLDDGAKRARVAADVADGNKYGVSGTPSFFIGSPSKGYVLLVGAQPFEAFQQVLDQELRS